jgi:hypothetical protein
MEMLRKKYNGYIFGINVNNGDLSESVFNPFGLGYVFKYSRLSDEWFQSGSPTFLLKTMAEQGNFSSFSFSVLQTSCTPYKFDPICLPYYSGYATLSSYDTKTNIITLCSPNDEISSLLDEEFWNYFFKVDKSQTINLCKEIADCFRKGVKSDENVLKNLLNQLYANASYEHLKSNEGNFVTLTEFVLRVGGIEENVQLEVHTNNGRIDMVINLKDKIYIIEFKFISKFNIKNENVAMKQIKDKDYALQYKEMGLPIFLVGIDINMDKRWKY